MREELLKKIKEKYGEIPFVTQELSKDEEYFVPRTKRVIHLMGGSALDTKTAELAAVAAATALKTPFCLDVHIRNAINAGATVDELFNVIEIAALISESSALGMSLREYRKVIDSIEG
ncbi:MAG TPA: carboxymuconolactone decarboxylase family protein [Methanofastidiosum sp.]|mgnify:FL=1|jgi:AhpD family alkylhydroperoxidase|nr:carboxymuconolactone decarboxylase family protein [Methanofastidiosum sp.]HNZ87978.1 carboxymuconolactone decarboxylase family protein [Methanofastidiosum sp.]HOC78188.1 carboxymuconolactone decarboxylase family protein [Methanofastidiosum sp.]HOG74291.1 carboxymuconolactone decarboxylase family protein [Methanofastidiosum sp.]HPA49502.1 carboxymuconolactone decarboxylase family protein [Methanofastidiosum sp.]